jgi:zinc and cadmium transporter
MYVAYTLISVVLVSLVSFVGVVSIGLREHWLRKTILLLVSFAAGALIGDAFLHLLPEIWLPDSSIFVAFAVLGGVVTSFIIEKYIWHHCHDHPHPVAYLNIFGDVVHNFVDGIVIAAAYLIDAPTGLATTVAVLMHEIPQELGDFAILVHAGMEKRKAIMYNFFTSLSAIAGAAVALILGTTPGIQIVLVGFAAGAFIYVSLADLVPELHKETSAVNSTLQFLMFIAGIAFMALLLALE